MTRMLVKPTIERALLDETKRDIKVVWSSFKNMFEKLEKNAADNERVQPFVYQIKIRIQNFEKAKNESGASAVGLLGCISQTEKHLDTIYWLMSDDEKPAIKDLKKEFTALCELLSDGTSVSRLLENESTESKAFPLDTPQRS
ncbi:MAG: hypothetical protein QXT45_00865 [Candidatus Bilamarchaeaceae archaeon]